MPVSPGGKSNGAALPGLERVRVQSWYKPSPHHGTPYTEGGLWFITRG